MDSHEWVRYGEGSDPEVENTPDTVAHHREEAVNETQVGEVDQCDVTLGVGESHGGFGNVSFRECLNLAAQSTNEPSAPYRSEGSVGETPVHMTNPSQLHTLNFLLSGNSQLHRTSVTQGLLAEIILCNSGASKQYSMNANITKYFL